VFQIAEITSDVDYLITRRGSLGAQAGSSKKTRLVHISDIVRIVWTELVDADYDLAIVRVHDHSDDNGHRNYLVEFPGAHDRRQFKWGSRHDLSKLAQNSVILATYDRLRQVGVDQLPLFQPFPLVAAPAAAAPIAAAAQSAPAVQVFPAGVSAAAVVVAPVAKRGPGRPKKPAAATAAAAPAVAAAAPAPVSRKKLKSWETIPVDRELRDRSSSK